MKFQNFKKSDTLVSLFVDSDGINNEQDLNNCLYSIAKQTHKVDLVILYNNLTDEEIAKLGAIANAPQLTTFKKDEEGKVITEKTSLSEGESLNYTIRKTNSKTFAQVFNNSFNNSVDNEYEFFSFIEQEDVLSLKWFDYSSRYFKEEEHVSIMLPLMKSVVNGIFTGVINEGAWVEGFAEEAGLIDMNLLLRFNIANILGAVFKTKSVQEYSEKKEDGLYYPFKESLRVVHSYEFFLRMIYNDLKIKTIPRLGYELRVITKQNFLETSSKTPQNVTVLPKELGGIPQNEIQFYVDLAKKEYFFENDRNIIFNG